jgi:hypothetical protein
MKITIYQLRDLFSVYGDNLEIKYFDDVSVEDNTFLSTDLVLPAHLGRLDKADVRELEVFYTPGLYDCLSKEFPVEFRKPCGGLRMSDMDRLVEGLRDANNQSKRKRFIRLVGEIYGLDMHSGKRTILVRHNEPLDFKKWNNIKREVDRNQVFLYRNSEVPVIIFVDLKVANQKVYIERFKINTDLISMMVTRGMDPSNVIAPDFIPTEDVISVTDPGLLLEEYIRSNARLIVMGEKLDDYYKRTLLQVRNYDKFVRLLVAPAVDFKNAHDFFSQVKQVYNSERWQ